jgi:hypothetical protein
MSSISDPRSHSLSLSKAHSCAQSRQRRCSRIVAGWWATELARNGIPCAAPQPGHVTGRPTEPGELTAIPATVVGIGRRGNGPAARVLGRSRGPVRRRGRIGLQEHLPDVLAGATAQAQARRLGVASYRACLDRPALGCTTRRALLRPDGSGGGVRHRLYSTEVSPLRQWHTTPGSAAEYAQRGRAPECRRGRSCFALVRRVAQQHPAAAAALASLPVHHAAAPVVTVRPHDDADPGPSRARVAGPHVGYTTMSLSKWCGASAIGALAGCSAGHARLLAAVGPCHHLTIVRSGLRDSREECCDDGDAGRTTQNRRTRRACRQRTPIEGTQGAFGGTSLEP